MKPLVSQTDATLCLYSQESNIASVSVIDNFPIGVIVRLMVFNNFKVISVVVSFIVGGNQSTRRKPSQWKTLSYNVVLLKVALSTIILPRNTWNYTNQHILYIFKENK